MSLGFGSLSLENKPSQNEIVEDIIKKIEDRNISKGTIFGSLSDGVTQQRENIVSFDKMYQMYRINEWVRSIIDKTVGKVVSFKPTIVAKDESKAKQKNVQNQIAIARAFMENPNKTKENWSQIRKKVLRDTLIYDAAGLYKHKTTRGGDDDILGKGNPLLKKSGLELITVAGNTIFLNVDETGRFKNLEKAYFQMLNNSSKKSATYAADELVYFLDNPSSGYVYGLSPLETLIMVVTSELYASTYNSDFFKNNATPRLAVMFDDMGNDPNGKMKRARKWWEKELKGQPHKPYFMGTSDGKVRIEKVGMSNNDMQFMDYSRWLLSKIIAVYKAQPFIVGNITGTTGKLNSEQQSKQWHEDAIKPLLELEAYFYNVEIFWPKSGLNLPDVVYKFPDAEFDLEEKEKRDESQIKDGRITINEWRKGRGLEDVDWGNAPWFNQSQAQPGSVSEPTNKSFSKKIKCSCGKTHKIENDQIKKKESDLQVMIYPH